jgi:hypothetical protein
MEFLVNGGDERDHFVPRLLAEEMKRPGAVLASAPTEQDSLRGGTVFCGFRHGTPPGGIDPLNQCF